MDKLRACIVANYYANAGMTKLQEVTSRISCLSRSCSAPVVWVGLVAVCSGPQQTSKSDPAVLNHPAIRRFLESPSRSSSPLNHGSETPSLAQSESESLSQHGDGADREAEGAWREDSSRPERRPGRNTGKVSYYLCQGERTFGVFYWAFWFSPLLLVGYIWCAISHGDRAEGDLPLHRRRDIQTLCKEDNRSGECVQVCDSSKEANVLLPRSLDSFLLLLSSVVVVTNNTQPEALWSERRSWNSTDWFPDLWWNISNYS